MNFDLFENLEPTEPSIEEIGEGAYLFRGKARASEKELLAALPGIIEISPFRHLVTPGGFTMSVAMTNAGRLGWVSDRHGYRYEPIDPLTGNAWPQMPKCFFDLAREAAAQAGYENFTPEACLINLYEPGARMSLHQDKDERNKEAPIVSISLGLPATFQFGGLSRSDKTKKYALRHGDIVVWGGSSRLCYHGVLALKDGEHPLLGRKRINITFRTAT